MLGKLMKYDIKSSRLEFIGIFVAIIAAALLLSFMSMTTNSTNSTIIIIVVPLLLMGLFVGSFAVALMTIFKMYNNRIYGREGYLTMTLPVKGWEVVSSKLLVTTMWLILTFIVFMISMFLFFTIISNMLDYSELWIAVSENIKWVAIIIISMIVQTLNTIVAMYLACSVANTAMFKKFKIIVGIGVFFLISIAESVLSSWAGDLLFSDFNQQLEATPMMMGNLSMGLNYIGNTIQPMLIFSLVLMVILAGIKFAATVWLVNRKLELE